jgi:hypothetical protein
MERNQIAMPAMMAMRKNTGMAVNPPEGAIIAIPDGNQKFPSEKI